MSEPRWSVEVSLVTGWAEVVCRLDVPRTPALDALIVDVVQSFGERFASEPDAARLWSGTFAAVGGGPEHHGVAFYTRDDGKLFFMCFDDESSADAFFHEMQEAGPPGTIAVLDGVRLSKGGTS